MKYVSRKNGSSVRNHLGGLIAVVGLCMILTGCATSRSRTKLLAPVYKPVESINLHFKRPLIVRMPKHDPATVENHIRCGLFSFDKDRFAKAAEEFERAKEMIVDPKSPIYRACLMSLATCHLLTDNKPGFIKTVKELRSAYIGYELMVVEDKDERVKAIFALYDEFTKTGNY